MERQAKYMAINPDEQAVSTNKAGPLRSKWYANLLAIIDLIFPATATSDASGSNDVNICR
ncbi:hypothetical protein D3C75_474830 [compost metagenome]